MHFLRPKGSKRLALWWICCMCAVLHRSKTAAISLTVNTTLGPIAGMNVLLPTGKPFFRYLGIPYAKATRFEQPKDPDKWNVTRNATAFGKNCPQPSFALLPGMAEASEDCLFINVFVPSQTPERNSSGFPVMLWVHGGAFVIGSADTWLYNGGVLASEEGVIVVTFNYRLGALGLLSTGRDNDLKGNYGLLDQVHAMKWVNNNIASFGGDPSRVTLFGESAGGMSISLLMLSPLTDGLYKNAILQSGAVPSLMTALLDDEPMERAKMFANALGCPDILNLKKCAANKNISDIITAQMSVFSTPLLAPFSPVVDGHFLKDPPLKILKDGSYRKEGSVMIGVTRDEGSLRALLIPGVQPGIPNIEQGLTYPDFLKRMNATVWVHNQNEQMVTSIIREYTNWANTSDVNANRQRFLDANADCLFKAPAILSAQLYDGKGMRTYFYELDYFSEKDAKNQTIPEWRRVAHGADLGYVFGLPVLAYPNDLNNTEVKFSKTIMKYWATFAKTGDPNPADQNAVKWLPYTSANQHYLSLQPVSEVKSNLLAGRMNFWNSYLGNLKSEEKKACPKDLAEELNEKENVILGLEIVVGVLVLLAIILIIVIIYLMRKTKPQTVFRKQKRK